MEKAVEVMRLSVPERRDDGKPSPKVGAVLLRKDDSIEVACRGELREGNHAEYTLLERKCLGELVEDCILFATLEPCLDRNQPKRGCARHIVSARIKEVYVGVEDDNPAVAGKGIEYLRRHGVTVHMFDRDLQDIILAENKTFFEWARQQTGKEMVEEPIKLSKYEDSVAATALQDLSGEAMSFYQSRAEVSAPAGSPEFRRLLQQTGMLVLKGGRLVPSGFGLILFGKNPANALPQARLLARAELADGQTSRKDFSGPLVLIPGQLEAWLKQVLPSTIDRNQMVRSERVDLPFEMLREAVVNALVHRDYDLEGQKCQLVVESDAIIIKSPGGPIPPITLAQMQSFSAPMKSRNPILHYAFARMGMAEEQGLGLTSLKREAQHLGLPLPRYMMEGESLVLTIYRSKAAVVGRLPENLRESLNKDELATWEYVSGRESVTSAEVMKQMGFDERKSQRVLKKLAEKALLQRVGKGPGTRFQTRRL